MIEWPLNTGVKAVYVVASKKQNKQKQTPASIELNFCPPLLFISWIIRSDDVCMAASIIPPTVHMDICVDLHAMALHSG